ncbi:MAG: heavy metal translocating P-type ATPase, partial [Firmicutes bacterium]|nr:heavy metal translocating P-type ATPase [Bacillota bacterium]
MPTIELAESTAKHYPLHGLDCANCAAKIEARLQQELDPGATISFATGTLLIDPNKVSQAQIIIDSLEPGVKIIMDDNDPGLGAKSGAPGDHHTNVQIWPLVAASLLFTFGLIFQSNLRAIAGPWGEYLVFLTAYFLVGHGVITVAVRNACRGQVFDENFLMTIATLGAFAIGNLPEAVGVMLFYYVGELLQDIAVSRSRNSIEALLEIRPEFANLKMIDSIKAVDPAEVAVGSVIMVRPGERVPLDGEVLTGDSFVDTSALTGESVPRRVSPGETVLAGMINHSG